MKTAKLICAGLLPAAVMLFSGCAGDDGTSPVEPATYDISGIVTEEAFTGPGLAGVTVSLESEPLATATATTGADGAYTFSSVSEGTYKLSASLNGHNVVPDVITLKVPLSVGGTSVPAMNFVAKARPGGLMALPRYTDNGDGTVTDDGTRLVWQKEQAGWAFWNDAVTYCNNNPAQLPGTGWRLPSSSELLSIVEEHGRDLFTAWWEVPAWNPVFGGNIGYSWSATEDNSVLAIAVDFGASTTFRFRTLFYPKDNALAVRCVRDGPRYVDLGDGTVKDFNTGLIWQRQDDAQERQWDNANTYCLYADQVAQLPGTGWRLPSKDELLGIVDMTRSDPAIDPIFANTRSTYYWSSSERDDGYRDGSWWGVSFYSGVASLELSWGWAYARCVRSP